MMATGVADQGMVISDYASVHAVLNSDDFSRSVDRGRFELGNILEDVVLVLDGAAHRDRRRVENRLFRRDTLTLYEHELFPSIIEDTLASAVVPGTTFDLMRIGGLLAIVLAARTVGIDFDAGSYDERERLLALQRVFSRGSSIDASINDPEDVKRDVRRALDEFNADFLKPSLARRREALAENRSLTLDLLSTLIGAHDALTDEQVLRECAFYLDAGVDTSTQSLTSTMDYLLVWHDEDPFGWEELAADLPLIQRCVHEALRLRPTNPRIVRRALADVTINGRPIPAGSLVILDTQTANRDPVIFGEDTDVFDPNRAISAGVPRTGFSFSGGLHACIGRGLAAGQNRAAEAEPEQQQFGLVSLMVQALAARCPHRVANQPPAAQGDTKRHTRWGSYPIVVDRDPNRHGL
jgi:cytochrome P450